jgi:hypothetical protein
MPYQRSESLPVHRLTSRPLAALLLLTLSLGAAAAGTATAAKEPTKAKTKTTNKEISGAQIKKGSITAAQIKKGTITAEQIKPGTLTKALLAAGVLPVLTPAPQVDAYTKAQSDARYLAGGAAVDAATLSSHPASDFLGAGAKAADADKLDGLDSAAFQRGTSQASGRQVSVPASGSTSGILFSLNGLDVQYTCYSGSIANIAIHPQTGVTFGFAVGQAFGGSSTTYSNWSGASVPISLQNTQGHFMVSNPVTGTGAGGSLLISIDATATTSGGKCEFGAMADAHDTRS